MRIDGHLTGVTAASTVYAVLFTWYMELKHQAFMTYMYDLGFYIQNMWMLASRGYPNFPWAASHGSMVIYPLAAIPLYSLAKVKLGGAWTATIISALYLLYPPIHGVTSYDFHLEAFIPLTILLMVYLHDTDRWKGYLASTMALLTIFEFSSVIAVVLTAYLSLKDDVRIGRGLNRRVRVIVKRPTGYEVMAIVLSLAFLTFYLHPVSGFAGHTVSGVQTHDLKVRMKYLELIYGPMAFIPIATTMQIPATPWLTFVMTTWWREVPRIYNQYPALIAPFAFLGAIEAIERMGYSSKARKIVLTAIVIATVLHMAYADPVLTNPYPPITLSWPIPTQKDRMLERIVQSIPEGTRVLTQNNIAPHLAYGRTVYITWRAGWVEPDYIIVDKSHFSYDEPTSDRPQWRRCPSS